MSPEILHFTIGGDGAPVVLLHPAGLDLTCWDAVVARLERRFRLLRLDLRGHGASPPAVPGMELADYAADVRHTLKHAGFAPAAVVGLSVGGMVAQTLALDSPDVVSRLVLAGCPCTLPAEARPVLAARGDRAVEAGMAAIVSETLERWFTPGFLGRGEVEAVRDRLLRDDPSGWNNVWKAISRLDTSARLHEIGVPTLCLAGELDAAAPPAALAGIARRIHGARLVVLEGAPHMMQVECPDAFAATVGGFLGGEMPTPA